MRITLDTDQLSPTAIDAIRFKFNPSGVGTVDYIKLLTGSLITELESVARVYPDALDQVNQAIAQVQTASMWSVLAATRQKADEEKAAAQEQGGQGSATA